MGNQTIPLAIDGINESIYADFWIRLGSMLLDVLILLPFIFLVFYLNGLNRNMYYFTLIPELIFHFWFNIYIVKKYGGTPGKLIVGIKILKLDGTDVTWREAILRHIIDFVFVIFLSIIMIYALSLVDVDHYESLGWLEKHKYLFGLSPILYKVYNWASNIWSYSELFVLLLNKRRRALHDYIAGTVVVHTKYIEKIREVINADQTNTESINA